MAGISGAVRNVEPVVEKIRSLPEDIEERARRVLALLGLELQGIVKDQYLSGQALNVRTSWLKSSITTQQHDDGTSITQTVGVHMPRPASPPKGGHPRIYGEAHEYGFEGIVTVSEHLRMQTMIFGRQVEPFPVFVPSHDVMLDLPEKSFLRAALREFEAHAREEIAKAVGEGVHA
jgi:hypothetical protein